MSELRVHRVALATEERPPGGVVITVLPEAGDRLVDAEPSVLNVGRDAYTREVW